MDTPEGDHRIAQIAEVGDGRVVALEVLLVRLPAVSRAVPIAPGCWCSRVIDASMRLGRFAGARPPTPPGGSQGE